VASGFPLTPLTWLGFSPHRVKDLSGWLERLGAIKHTVCFLESPHRIEHTLQQLAISLGDRPICLARELTKAHQEIIRGPASQILEQIRSLKGEFTLVVGPVTIDKEATVAAATVT
jgi:16S rRNA (cytidine1402-2'-O)-methyltransferase